MSWILSSNSSGSTQPRFTCPRPHAYNGHIDSLTDSVINYTCGLNLRVYDRFHLQEFIEGNCHIFLVQLRVHDLSYPQQQLIELLHSSHTVTVYPLGDQLCCTCVKLMMKISSSVMMSAAAMLFRLKKLSDNVLSIF
jgi:hypothetical protein